MYYILNIWYTIFNSIRKIICDLDYTQMCYTSIPRWNNKVEQLHIMLSALEYWIESFQFILYATGWIAQIIFSKKDITLFWYIHLFLIDFKSISLLSMKNWRNEDYFLKERKSVYV